MNSTRSQPSTPAISVLRPPAQTGSGRSFWKASSEKLQREGIVIWFLLKDNQSPWYTKMIAGCVLAYVLSPVQLIPSFIPVIGLSDDLLVLSAGAGLIHKLTPPQIVQQARERAMASMAAGENIRPQAVQAATLAAVMIVWLAITVWVSVAMFHG